MGDPRVTHDSGITIPAHEWLALKDRVAELEAALAEVISRANMVIEDPQDDGDLGKLRAAVWAAGRLLREPIRAPEPPSEWADPGKTLNEADYGKSRRREGKGKRMSYASWIGSKASAMPVSNAQAGPPRATKPCHHDSTRGDGTLDSCCLKCGWDGYWHNGQRLDEAHPSGKILFRLPTNESETP